MSEKRFNVVIAGATGVVGNQMITCLKERNFPVKSIRFLASSRSAGQTLEYKGDEVVVEELTESSFKGSDIAIFSAGGGTSEKFALSQNIQIRESLRIRIVQPFRWLFRYTLCIKHMA